MESPVDQQQNPVHRTRTSPAPYSQQRHIVLGLASRNRACRCKDCLVWPVQRIAQACSSSSQPCRPFYAYVARVPTTRSTDACGCKCCSEDVERRIVESVCNLRQARVLYQRRSHHWCWQNRRRGHEGRHRGLASRIQQVSPTKGSSCLLWNPKG